MKRITILLLLAALCCAASDKTPNRKVGGGLNFFSVEEESAMGRRYSAEMNRKLDLIEDPRIAGYVTRLGRRLAADSRAPGVEYRFFVVNTREVNAFAMPGGFIYVNRGLIELAATESELAGVIGHEIGHVVGRHSTKQMSKQLLLAGIVMATTAAVGTRSQRWAQVVGTLGGVGVFFAAMKHSRNDERQSDWLGLENMNRSGYDPRGLMTFFEKLDQTAKGKGGGTGLAFLSSHPVPAERVRNMESEIALLGSTANAAAVDPAGFAACREQLRAIPLPAGGKDKTLGSALAQLDPAENRSGPAEPRPANDASVRTIAVPGNSVWVDTGIDVAPGQSVRVWAEGQVFWKKNSEENCDPAGAPATAGKGWLKPVTGVNTAALIGKIGGDSKPFEIGAFRAFEPLVAGRLQLGINDDNNFDNRGGYEVQIRIVGRR